MDVPIEFIESEWIITFDNRFIGQNNTKEFERVKDFKLEN
jgi:hypothetical protein